MLYPVAKENKLYLKGEVEGELNGIFEGELTESTPQSGIFDKFQATFKLNRLKTETASVTLNLEGMLSYQSSHVFNSDIHLYQGSFEGSAFGSYTGPLSAVLTHLRLTSENEYKGQGFSILSYNSTLGSSDAYAYNQTNSPEIISFNGIFNSPLLGKLTAVLDENKAPKTLSGTIERLDLGIEPQADLKVQVWGPTRVSPGQTVNYLIELRNDGLKTAYEKSIVLFPVEQSAFVSGTNPHNLYTFTFGDKTGRIYNGSVIKWNFEEIPAKTTRLLNSQITLNWGIPQGAVFKNEVFILDKQEADNILNK